MGFIGILSGGIYLLYVSLRMGKYVTGRNNYDFEDLLFVYIWSIIFALLGAKILYLLVEWQNIVRVLKNDMVSIRDLYPYLSGGFVFYGGLFGAIIGCYLSCTFFSYDKETVIERILPTLPLVHAFGRVGCAIVGCCYGRQTNSFLYIQYYHSEYAPNFVHLIPTQLIEAGFELLLFVIVAVLCIKRVARGFLLIKVYLVVYALFRFIIEFWRGDEVRGLIWGMSTSQWISLIIVFSIFPMLFKHKDRKL